MFDGWHAPAAGWSVLPKYHARAVANTVGIYRVSRYFGILTRYIVAQLAMISLPCVHIQSHGCFDDDVIAQPEYHDNTEYRSIFVTVYRLSKNLILPKLNVNKHLFWKDVTSHFFFF